MDFRIPLFFIALFLIFGALFHQRESETTPRVVSASRGPVAILQNDKKSVTPTNSRQPSSEGTQPQQAQANDPEDVCAWIQGTSSPDTIRSNAQSVLKDFQQNLSSETLDTLEWLYQTPNAKARSPQSTAQLFLESLEEGGMLLGRTPPRRLNVPKSIELLEKAQIQDPANGALDLYLAALYLRQGRGADATEALRQGLKKDHFNVYMADLSKQLLSAPQNSLQFLKAVELFSTMPIPDMNPLREPLLALTRSDDFAGDVFRFAERIVDQAVGSRSPYNHLDWWLSSYVMAGQILNRRGQDVPRSFDLHQEFNRFPDLSIVTSKKERCNPVQLQRSIDQFQSIIRQSAAQ